MKLKEKVAALRNAVAFLPAVELERPAATAGGHLPHSQLDFRTKDGFRLTGWYTGASTGEDSALGTVVHLHPARGDVRSYNREVVFLAANGFNLLAFDYRGYGRSQGTPSLEGALADLDAAIDMLYKRGKAQPGSLCLFGQELGAGLAVVAAARRKDLAGLVLEAPFLRFRDRERAAARHAKGLGKIGRFLASVFSSPTVEDPITVAPKVKCPALVVHALADREIRYTEGQELYRKVGGRKQIWRIEEAGHLEYPTDALRLEYEQRLVAFFRQCCTG